MSPSPEPDRPASPAGPDDSHSEESDLERAEELAREVGEENPDPTTRREAIEQALAEEGLSEEGEEIGQHND